MDTTSIPFMPPSSDAKNDEKYDDEGSSVRHPFVSVLSMRGGDGQNSYANNSLLQRKVIQKAMPTLAKNTKEMFINMNFPTYIRVADLGCSSGPNTFLVMFEIINTIDVLCQKTGRKSPEFDFSLNDLTENDFNTTFKLVSFFHEEIKKELSCFISGVPGSFYRRLFPANSLHFIHSSYSLHFLSKVPEGVEKNIGNVFITSSSPPSVYKAYLYQYRRDFSWFLRLCSEEMISGGRMVLTLIGRRRVPDPLYRDCCHFWTILSASLRDLVFEGLVSELELDSFKMPFYDPNEEEMREIIQNEGSFETEKIETHEFNLGDSICNNKNNEYYASGQSEANCIRAVTQPMLVAHFGDSIIDPLFAKYAEQVVHHANCHHKTSVNLVLSLTKK